jgi:hypothetical protein
MTTNRVRAFVAATLMILSVPSYAFAATATPLPGAADVTKACANVETDAKVKTDCATALEKALSADPGSLKLLEGAAKSRNVEPAKALLLKAGLAPKQLEGAKVMVTDGGGKALRIKVTVTITCCPLTITITLKR